MTDQANEEPPRCPFCGIVLSYGSTPGCVNMECVNNVEVSAKTWKSFWYCREIDRLKAAYHQCLEIRLERDVTNLELLGEIEMWKKKFEAVEERVK